MHVDTMQALVDEFERDSFAIPEACVARWEPGVTLHFLRVSANVLFRFGRGLDARFLRLAHESERTAAEIAAELELIRHAAAEGNRVACPLPSSSGRWVESVPTELGTYHAVLFERAPGRSLDQDPLDAQTMRLWGSALGQLHRASRTLPESVAGARRSWEDDVEAARRGLVGESPEIRAALEVDVRWLESLPRGPDDFGLIHYDFASDNVFRDDDRLCAIDFDDASRYWYAADIPYALEPDTDPARIADFAEGYRTQRELDSNWVDALPRFARFGHLAKLARLLGAYAGSDPNRDRPWRSAMRGRHVGLLDELRALVSSSA